MLTPAHHLRSSWFVALGTVSDRWLLDRTDRSQDGPVPGPRLVHTPSEPSGSQRSVAVHRSTRWQVRSWGNRPGCRTLIGMSPSLGHSPSRSRLGELRPYLRSRPGDNSLDEAQCQCREDGAALREQAMSSLRDKLHWVGCKLHVHCWRPEKDYQGKWYRECRDCGTISGMSMFPPGAG